MFPRRTTPLVALLLTLIAPACQSTQRQVLTRAYGYAPVMPANLGSMRNVSVSDEVWIGSFPSAADLDLAHRRGIATIIDLATPQETPAYDVAATCARVSIHYISAGIESNGCVSDAIVDRVLAELCKPEQRPLLLVCGNGSRAAMLFAIHRAVDEGLSLADALVDARRAGMKPGHPEVFVRRQVERLTAVPPSGPSGSGGPSGAAANGPAIPVNTPSASN